VFDLRRPALDHEPAPPQPIKGKRRPLEILAGGEIAVGDAALRGEVQLATAQCGGRNVDLNLANGVLPS
jgi:hypothetical protein